MYTLVDYINYYKDKTIAEIKWNDIDNMICSMLTYLPVEPFYGSKSFDDFYDYSMEYKNNLKYSYVIRTAYEILDLMYESKRYCHMRVYNVSKILNNKTQFGAMTFRIGSNTVIAFEGTDKSLIGWIENFRISYEYPSYTQSLAINYLDNNINMFDNNVIVTGHSKGGNMAIVSAINMYGYKQSRINRIVNFDGPGLKHDVFISPKYLRNKDKIVTYIPDNSMVGVILEHDSYNVVRGDSFVVKEHYPNTWYLFGEFFVPSKLSSVSQKLHDMTANNFKNISDDRLRDAFETIFNSLGKEMTSDIKLDLNEFKEIYHSIKTIDPEVKKDLDLVVKELMKFTVKK